MKKAAVCEILVYFCAFARVLVALFLLIKYNYEKFLSKVSTADQLADQCFYRIKYQARVQGGTAPVKGDHIWLTK